MEIQYLDWDSHFFNLRIGKICLDDSTRYDISDIRKGLEESNLDLVYVFTRNKLVDIEPVDQKLTYINRDADANILDNHIIDYTGSPDSLYELAYQAGHKSRFKVDPHIPDNDFKRLYRLWVDNSINKSFADYVKVYVENNMPLGFITAKRYPGMISIGLIAVTHESRGKGIGRKLMASIMAVAKYENLPVEVVTQRDNIGARRFYESMGFSIGENYQVYHLWKNVPKE